ncbi:MAG: VWA domain-containing protein [Fidelibacterota bacterium]
MIEFEKPWFLLFLGLIPLIYYMQTKWATRWEGSIRISAKELVPDNLRKKGYRRVTILRILQSIILILLIIGIARPRWVDALQESKVDVVDIELVLDISSSMLATDFAPNRLEAVKETAKSFIRRRSGDRLGLLVFAGEAFIQCPLTMDQDVLVSLLSEVRVAEQSYDGTAIGMALAHATNRLRNSQAKSKVIILLSDGSNNAGELDPLTAADLAAQFGIRIYTIGAGTNESVSFIPGRGYIRNEIDEETLQAIAQRTGGRYFRAVDKAGLDDIYAQIDELERTEIEVRNYTRYRELFAWFLLPAFVLGMGVETLERDIYRKRT